MVRISLEKIINKARSKKGVVIVCAGKVGVELYNWLKQSGTMVEVFFDNNPDDVSLPFPDVMVIKPDNLGDDYLYVISAMNSNTRKIVKNQLMDMGISSEDIEIYYPIRDYEYVSTLEPSLYQDEISDFYRLKHGYCMDWDNPRRYNEILNWEKLNVVDKRRTLFSDKVAVKRIVGDIIGNEHIVKMYGYWDNPEDIDFDILPDKFVLKVNNGSGRNIVIKDKNEINKLEIIKTLKGWMMENYAYWCMELHYKDIPPMVFAEEYLEGVADTVYDYNIYCFHGEPIYIWCINGSHKENCKASFYDINWNMQEFCYGYPKDPVLAPKPEKLEEMLVYSRKLSKDFEHVRVDFYNLPDGRVLFGEITFASWAGYARFYPDKYDYLFGDLIKNGQK